MPKKQVRNSFYFYMLDYREQQKKMGVHYANMQELSVAAGPAWARLMPKERIKFENQAKEEKRRLNVPENKFTSDGTPFSEIDRLNEERKRADEMERQDIHDFITQKNVSGELLNEDIFLMDVNCYCKVNGLNIVGEVSVVRLSVRHGIQDFYHTLICTGPPPIGYASDFKIACQELGLPPSDEGERTSPAQLLATIVDYLRKTQRDRLRAPLPAIYTMPDKVPVVQDFIQQLCLKAAEDEGMFRVYRLPILLFALLNALSGADTFPRESLALVALKKDTFMLTPGLACNHHSVHMDGERACQCCLARAQRWGFIVLDHAVKAANIPPEAGRHIPHDFDYESIQAIREERGGVANRSFMSAVNDSTASSTVSARTNNASYSSAATAASAASAATGPPKRVHIPLRKPTVDYSSQLRAAPPQLHAEADFPEFPAPVVTRGRGRGEPPSLSSSMDRLRM